MHLYYADLFTSLLKRALLECDSSDGDASELDWSRSGASAGTRSGSRPGIAQLHASGITLSRIGSAAQSAHKATRQLPLPLFNHTGSNCDPSKPPLLDISAEDVMRNQSIIGTWKRIPSSSHFKGGLNDLQGDHQGVWKLKSEGRNRVGWVHEKHVPHTNRSGADPLQQSNAMSNPSLVFWPPRHEIFEEMDDSHMYLLQIQFLRTYHNAGQATVFICGQALNGAPGMLEGGRLDALWQSYDEYKRSLPEFYTVTLPWKLWDPNEHPCRRDNATRLGVRIEYADQVKCLRETPEACELEAKARTKLQKFKVISVKICAIEKEE